MRQLFCVFVALLCANAGAGVGRWSEVNAAKNIDPKEGAALFVGISIFPWDKTLATVPYAVDDAVDLAYELTMEPRSPLVDAKRVVLALSGEPQKAESQEKLKKLLAAGAARHDATTEDILAQLESQSRSVGSSGIYIAAFATHGVSDDGIQYLLTASSMLEHYRRSLTEAEIRETISRNGVARSLIFIDACRERLVKDRRNGDVDPRSVATFFRSVGRITGQVVFSAAPGGGYAYDDEERRNGVFTATVIEGLHCGARANAEGFITVDTLHSYVESHVLAWLQEHKNRDAKTATQWTSEGNSKDLPLSICVSGTAKASQRPAR
ncbi:MAG: caspase family protein [Acidobacteria bacterium]|nr:caspase family protein [Acidobacteriota bacterium]MBV9184998.1 caspase family protein [Acidobacteriota bacterium]